MPEFTDDHTITDEADLWRRIPPMHIVYDGNLNSFRPSSAAFDDHKASGTPMSVLLADVMLEMERGPNDALAGHLNYSLAAVSAGLVRSQELGVAKDPIPSEPAHAVVFGKKSKSVRKTLARAARWVIAPTK